MDYCTFINQNYLKTEMDLEYKDVTDIIDASGLKITDNFEKCRSYLCLILCVCVFIVFYSRVPKFSHGGPVSCSV